MPIIASCWRNRGYHIGMETIDTQVCSRARLARDSRYDGRFFIAVKTTGIFCRPVCPVKPPKEQNVSYYANAQGALAAGFRPCLRCRPDSAPGSYAWLGSETTLRRALRLIDEGALDSHGLPQLAERLGVSDRYVRKLFAEHLGVSPKEYAQMNRLMFAKKLLHETRLPIQDIAYAAGFNRIRSFNTAFKKSMRLAPGAVRKTETLPVPAGAGPMKLTLSYRPPFNWDYVLDFYRSEDDSRNGVGCRRYLWKNNGAW